ncbi:MAG: M42 family peptidase [Oscillospiraceae bacterium]|nr:M42 family peptidase [Oscillospiraceae bacterium]
MIDLLSKLCSLNGTSGAERDVRDYICSKIKSAQNSDGDCEIKTDNLGNLIVFKKGKKRAKNKIMLCAHMDEVGFIVDYITSDGLVKIKNIGGINPAAIIGRRLMFGSVAGVVGAKPIHKLKSDEKEKQPGIDELFVDIGVSFREETVEHISLGDNGYFIGEFCEMGDNLVMAKAIDDRLGCAILIEMLSKTQEYDAHYVFTTAEEVGTRGASAAAFAVKPDMAIVLEATTAADIPGVKDGDIVCKLGEGPVVSYMDSGAIYDKELYDTAFFTARENGIKCQTKTKIAGGNDSGVIHKTLSGIRVVALSAPCRYLHTANCVINKSDLKEMLSLAEKLFEKMAIL